jgi:lipopolysaccharide export system ATP-binding protein
LNNLHISHTAKQKAYPLSGGEKRRLEIARTLSLKPKFLPMDESFSGVDPISVSDLQKIIISLKDCRIGVLITDHNVGETLSIVDLAYLIHDGRILCHGDRDTLLNDEASGKFYLRNDLKVEFIFWLELNPKRLLVRGLDEFEYNSFRICGVPDWIDIVCARGVAFLRR